MRIDKARSLRHRYRARIKDRICEVCKHPPYFRCTTLDCKSVMCDEHARFYGPFPMCEACLKRKVAN